MLQHCDRLLSQVLNLSADVVSAEVSTPIDILLPPVIQRAMERGAALAISVSGGKDSDAMLRQTIAFYRQAGWTGKIFAIFADLGRIEWPGVLEHLHRLCGELGIELVTVKRPQGGMVDRWQQRFDSIAASDQDKPGWSSSTNRYCTDHLKVQQIDKELRQTTSKPGWSDAGNRYCTAELKRQQVDKNLRSEQLVICAVGIRAEESPNRAKEPRYCVRSNITTESLKMPALSSIHKALKFIPKAASMLLPLFQLRVMAQSVLSLLYDPKDKSKTSEFEELWADAALDEWLESGQQGRLSFTWHPIFHYTLDQVWAANGTSREDLARRVELFLQGLFREALEGFPCHWAYVASNTRLSCSMCVLASIADLINGAKHNPLIWLELALMELTTGWGFKQDVWLTSLTAHVAKLTPDYFRRLYAVLHELQLVRRWGALFSLQFMGDMPIEMTVFWTYEIVQFATTEEGSNVNQD